jgi:hypothetical protein
MVCKWDWASHPLDKISGQHAQRRKPLAGWGNLCHRRGCRSCGPKKTWIHRCNSISNIFSLTCGPTDAERRGWQAPAASGAGQVPNFQDVAPWRLPRPWQNESCSRGARWSSYISLSAWLCKPGNARTIFASVSGGERFSPSEYRQSENPKMINFARKTALQSRAAMQSTGPVEPQN